MSVARSSTASAAAFLALRSAKTQRGPWNGRPLTHVDCWRSVALLRALRSSSSCTFGELLDDKQPPRENALERKLWRQALKSLIESRLVERRNDRLFITEAGRRAMPSRRYA